MSIYNDQENPFDTLDAASSDGHGEDDRAAEERLLEVNGDKLTENAENVEKSYDITI